MPDHLFVQKQYYILYTIYSLQSSEEQQAFYQAHMVGDEGTK